MAAINDFDVELEELQRCSVGRLMQADIFDKKAFEALRNHLCAKAEALKMEYVVSKQILSTILSAARGIESRAEYLPEVRDNAHLASVFAMILDLIARGKSCADRKPGVPRII